MIARLRINRAGALANLQDSGRRGYLFAGIAASGPMDRIGFADAAARLEGAGRTAIECTTGGIELVVEWGACRVGFSGGSFSITHNGTVVSWPGSTTLGAGEVLTVTAGPAGNFAYLRFDADIAAAPVLGSTATNSRVGLGGRTLVAGDVIDLVEPRVLDPGTPATADHDGPIRVTWGLHATLFSRETRAALLEQPFRVTSQMDRMGMRLSDEGGVFTTRPDLHLISDAIVAGDIQILGDGTPIVLMRDHQPTGGYPRIATVISADLDRLAQSRPGSSVRFRSVSVKHAQALLRQRG